MKTEADLYQCPNSCVDFYTDEGGNTACCACAKIKEDGVKSIDRASALYHGPIKQAPAAAVDYMKHLSRKYGASGEVLLTAFAHYAECCEGAEPSDGYEADDDAKTFFATRE